MKKNKLLFISTIFAAMALSSCGTIYNIYEKQEKKEKDPAELTSLIQDDKFVRGIGVVKDENITTHYSDIEYKNYTGIVGATYDWMLTQWHRASQYELSSASMSSSGGYYTYANDARAFSVNPTLGNFRLKLDTGLEYQAKYGHKKNDDYQNTWSHFLLENFFDKGENSSILMRGVNTIPVTFDLTINNATFDGDPLSEDEKNTGLNAAQFLIYFRIAYDSDGDAGEHESDKAMWIGMPIYDSRYNMISKYVAIDSGHANASNDLIYSASNAAYLPVSNDRGLEIGKKYHVQYDLLPLIREAFTYAAQLDASLYPDTSFAGLDFAQLQLYYCNIGFECPGAFNMDFSIDGFSVGYN